MQTTIGDSPRAPRRADYWKSLRRTLTILSLLICLVAATRQEAAAWYARSGTLEGLRKAQSWDPSNPAYPAAIAHLKSRHLETADPQSILKDLETATRLGPNRAIDLANLAEEYDLSGESERAEKAFELALQVFPKSPEINWDYANFLIRKGEVERAMRPLRVVVLGDSSLREPAFDVLWRAGANRHEILEMLPAQQEILAAYLDYLVRTQRMNDAAEVWWRLAASREAIDTDAAFRYFDALLGKHQVDGLETVWADLERHDAAKFHSEPGGRNLITDGNFERAIPNGGFGWRAVPVEGAKISADSSATQDGSRAIKVEFAGKENLDFGNVVQYVAVQPATNYRFRALARREGITTDSGPRIAVYDAYDHDALWVETPNLIGSAGWEEQALDFRTGPQTRLLVVQIRRPASKKLDNRIAGTLWTTGFSLIADR